MDAVHLHHMNFYAQCRDALDSDSVLTDSWLSLFEYPNEEDIEDEIFLVMVNEMYVDVTQHFLRISIADMLKKLKPTLPRKKKQALRSMLTGMNTNSNKTRGRDVVRQMERRKILPIINVMFAMRYVTRNQRKWVIKA